MELENSSWYLETKEMASRCIGFTLALPKRSFAQGLVLAISIPVFVLSACSKTPGTHHYDRIQSNSINDGRRGQDAATICNRIPDIKLLPFHSERGRDATYDAFMDAGELAVPCLIQKITDTTRVPDPRETLKSPDTTIGDVAYFLIIEITKRDFAEFLPPDVQKQYKDQGVFAYYKYVQKIKNRERLQSRLNDWWQTSRGGQEISSLAAASAQRG
jgi:hypothetical protein